MYGESIVLALGVNTVAAWGPGGAATSLDLRSVFGAKKASEPGAGRKAILIVAPENTAAADANQAGNIQTSPDDSTWSNVQAYAAADGWKMFMVPLDRYIRVNNTGGTTQITNFYLLV